MSSGFYNLISYWLHLVRFPIFYDSSKFSIISLTKGVKLRTIAIESLLFWKCKYCCCCKEALKHYFFFFYWLLFQNCQAFLCKDLVFKNTCKSFWSKEILYEPCSILKMNGCCRPLKFKNNFASFQCLVSAKLKSYFRYLLLWCSSPAKLKQQKTTTKLVTTAKPNFLLVPKSLDDDQSKMLLFAFRLIVYWVFMGLPLLDDQTFGYQSINKTSFDETLEELL